MTRNPGDTMTNAQAKRAGRRAAKANGHVLDGWSREAGRDVAVCRCGGYVAIEWCGRDGWLPATGRMRVAGAVRPDGPCPLT